MEKEIFYKKKLAGKDLTTNYNVYLEVRIKSVDLSNQKSLKETIEHKVINKYKTLSISGYSVDRGGQIYDFLLSKEFKPLKNFNVKRLVEIWKRWHLNDLRPGCIHQEKPIRGKEWDTLEWERLTKMCPKGYRYGSKWLVEELPEDIINEVIELLNF